MAVTDLPTGTITFLFTDIEGSTRLWEEAPEETLLALKRHDEIMAGAITGQGGFVHRPRGEGDSQFAVFPYASDAVAAAALIQQQFFAEPWPTPQPLKVRIALHTGEANLRLGDYYGSEVNRCARLRSLAHGGQVLLSGATWGLVQDALPAGVTVEDEGEHRLKDLSQPEHVYQLVIAGLPFEFPPLMSLSASLTNLPVQATPFVGRQEEVDALTGLLQPGDRRLVTLVGPGGMGKTRLAIQAASQLVDSYPDGVYFVPLAPLSAAGQIVQAIIEALGITFAGGGDLQALLFRYLRRRQALLLLDNFEHLLDGAPVLADLLRATPTITLLATSREKLNLSGETVYNVSGLAVADWQSPAELLAHSCGQLFVQSAQRADPEYELRAEDVRPIATICRLVAGMPLGILLAAAWVDQLRPQEIAAEISQSLDFLETEMRDVPARQRSIRAVFETSWERLSQPEQALFKKLSLFRGGFTREAAREVAGASMRQLAGLVNKSFLRRDSDTGRYDVHELLRQYAAELLAAEPEQGTAAREAHAAYFTDLLEKLLGALHSERQRAALDEIEADIENVRVTWHTLAGQGRATAMGRIVESLWYFHEIRSWYHAGVDLFERAEVALIAAGIDEEGEAVTAQVRAIRGFFVTVMGSAQAGSELAEEGLATLGRLGRRQEKLVPLLGLFVARLFLNRGAAAVEAGAEILEIAEELGNRWWVAAGYIGLGSGSMTAQAFADARRYAEEAASRWAQIGDPWGATWPANVLARLAVMAGNYGEARERFQFVLDQAQSVNFRRGLQYTYRGLGDVSFRLEDYLEAEAYYIQSLTISDEIDQTREVVATFYDIARVWATTDRAGQALELLAIVLPHPASAQHALFRPATIHEDAEALRRQLEERLPAAAYAEAWERGRRRELQAVVDGVLAAGAGANGA